MNNTIVKNTENIAWTDIIKPRTGWFDINLREIWHYKDLITLFVKRNFAIQYKQSILGPLWFFIQPLLTTVVFTVIFGTIAKISTDGAPQILFYMAGTIMWSYFANCLNNTSDTFIANAAIFGKVYFPRLTVPISLVLTNILTFLIQFLTFIAFLIYYQLHGDALKPNIYMLLSPLLLLEMAALGMGVGIWVSSLTTKYRDLRFLLVFGVQLWMYATPVVYPMSIIPDKWKFLMALNPMAPVVESFRYAFLGKGTVTFTELLTSGIVTFIILASGIVMFSRIEKNFMDMV
ncbi:MAG: ABC transporter permease [Brevinematales bacterium]|jgi:lipopolysaccharide transport system permease protein